MATKKAEKPSECSNCTKRVAGDVCLVEDDCCIRCGRDVSAAGEEGYWRAKIDGQAAVIEDLLGAHEALASHGTQAILAGDLLAAVQCLVSHHNALAESRRNARG